MTRPGAAASSGVREAIPPQTDQTGGPITRRRDGLAQHAEAQRQKFVRDRCSVTAGSRAYHWFLACSRP